MFHCTYNKSIEQRLNYTNISFGRCRYHTEIISLFYLFEEFNFFRKWKTQLNLTFNEKKEKKNNKIIDTVYSVQYRPIEYKSKVLFSFCLLYKHTNTQFSVQYTMTSIMTCFDDYFHSFR